MSARVCLLLALLLGVLRSSAAFAQAAPPAASMPPPRYALQVAPLRCPECECDRARDDLIALKGEYARVHRLASTKSSRLMMLGGFIGAGGALLLTAIGARQTAGDGQTRLVIFGVGVTVVGLAVGVMGMHRYRQREREAAPYAERDRELRLAVQDARLARRDLCRGVRHGR